MKLTKVLKKADDYIQYKAAIEYMEGAKHIIVHEGYPTKYPCLVISELNGNVLVPCYRHQFVYPEDLKDLEEFAGKIEDEDIDDLVKASLESKVKGFAEPPKLSLVKPPLCSQGRCVEDGTFWCTRMNAFFCDYDRHYASCCTLVPEAPPMCEHGCKNRFQYWRCKATNAIYCILHYHAGTCCQPIETPKSMIIASPSEEGRKRRCKHGCVLDYGYYWCAREATRFCSRHAHITGSCCTWTVMSRSSGAESRPIRPKIEGVHCQEGCQTDVDHFCTQLLEYRCSIHCHAEKCCRYIYGSQAGSSALKVVDHRDGAEPEAVPEPEAPDPREVKFVEEPDDAKAK